MRAFLHHGWANGSTIKGSGQKLKSVWMLATRILFLKASLNNLLLSLLHGWPVQPLSTRLGQKPCQAHAMSPLAAWLTMVMLRRHPSPWRHCRRVPMPWCCSFFFLSCFGVFMDMTQSSPCVGAVLLVLVRFSKVNWMTSFFLP